MDPIEYNMNLKGDDDVDNDDDDMAQSVQTFETILKRKLEMTAEDLTRASSTLCRPQPSSNLSPSPSTSLPGEKVGILTCGKGLEVCTNKPKDGVQLVPAFYRAIAEYNLKPTCTDIKRYLAEAGKTFDDESIQNLLLRVQEKGWQEVTAYHYEQEYSLPPGTGHKHFRVLDKEIRIYSPESGSSGSMFPPAEKDVIPLEKKLKKCSNKPEPFPTARVMVHRAYYKATYEQGIKYPTLSDIKGIIEYLWRSSFCDGIPEDPIPDEEIESIRLKIRDSGIYLHEMIR